MHATPSLFYRPAAACSKLKLAATLLHILVCGWERLTTEALAIDSIPMVSAECHRIKGNNSPYGGAVLFCGRLTDLPHLVCTTESFADTDAFRYTLHRFAIDLERCRYPRSGQQKWLFTWDSHLLVSAAAYAPQVLQSRKRLAL